MYSLPQKLAAEFIGTFALVFVAAGSICADQFLSANGQSRAGLMGIAVAQGLAYAVMIAALGHISGGHFNPAVTIGFWVTRRLGTFRSIFYWIAQFLGALAAAYTIKSMLPDSGWSVRALGAITPDLGGDFTRAQAIELETIMTFFLVFVFFATVVDAKSFSSRVAGFVVGLTFTVDILMGGPFTGAGLNPARVLGTAIATRHWGNHGVYWVGPLLGGVLAAFIYDRFFLRDQPAV
jgi:MIP family channel proteins